LIYLDANVFVYSALDKKAIGNNARAIVRDIQLGKLAAGTSALTFDELVWAVRKQRGEQAGALAGEVFLNTPHLVILDVRHEVLLASLALIKIYHFQPRDAVHAATALGSSAEYIVSEDRDYDVLATKIRRKQILDVST
jgi:predicted nucleic acid-binding protein